ncbi:ABC transporter ATP-binding protein [Trinickia caryophylli]|uniref:Cu-processing system ATP-binding protein n=1 Tax=Trinickia caryophylli TaxID=28094 RepID=A0A1X7FA73_TRICW|nr:ABC transporter ATP-binding protein [Trinickia caryophylli]PMS10943.1 ABC transporter ATP-binding protein [Trinickia caryophylli]TRX18890.1 ABC transporter ATP-binding protein [Trinickia caryophylli]WQE10312.1 ABC transporter ATP-binding protein [Trinickia caryophylli]SMF49061.1 Cu-processing system ATP-binding protein [Trinickia caryophylli]
MQHVIEAAGLGKQYGSAWALAGIDMRVAPGEVVGLLGHNGAGKSTLMKLMLGLIRPSRGMLNVLGAAPAGAHARSLRLALGYLPENVAFYGNLTGRETLVYLAELKRAPKTEAAALLARVGLADAADRRVRTYSKGMRQRLGLAQALLGEPSLLLLDEPTSGLDPAATDDFFALVHGLRQQGRTIVISSHVLAELEPHLDRAVILGGGQLVAHGTMAELQAEAGLPVTITARFVGGTDAARIDAWLRELADAAPRRGNDTVEFDVPRHAKLEMVRRLLQVPHLADIEVREATLARLYAAIGTRNPALGGPAQ